MAKNTIHHNTTTNKKPFVSDLLLYGEQIQIGTIVSASTGRTPSFSEKTPFVPRGADSSGDTEATDCTATPTYWDGALRMDMDYGWDNGYCSVVSKFKVSFWAPSLGLMYL